MANKIENEIVFGKVSKELLMHRAHCESQTEIYGNCLLNMEHSKHFKPNDSAMISFDTPTFLLKHKRMKFC